MTDLVVQPALVMLAAALLVAATRGVLRNAVLLLAPLMTLWAVWQIGDGVQVVGNFLDYEIQPVEGSPPAGSPGTCPG